LIEPLIARSVTLAAQTWAILGRDASQPVTDLECVYADSALAMRRQQLQAIRASGNVVNARLRRKVQVVSITEANPEVMRSGVEAIVIERWAGKVVHPDGSEDDLEPRRQTWRYVLQRKHGDVADSATCAAGLVITEAAPQP
jgi:hypothetical protein